jgi:chromosome segregation ATPase
MSRKIHGNLILLMLAAGVAACVLEYCTTWTTEQQQNNPVGYIGWLIRDLERDQEALRTVRGRLQRERQRLCEEQQRIEQRCRAAASAAVELRDKHQSGQNRVLALGQMWTRDQIETQVSSLLAELRSGESSLGHIESCRATVEEELERLTTQETEIQAGLRLLAAQRELVLSRRAGGVSLDQLSLQVQGLLSSSRQVQDAASRGLSASLSAASVASR